MLVTAAALTFAGAIFLFFMALASTRNLMRERLRMLERGGMPEVISQGRPVSERLFVPAFNTLASATAKVLPNSWVGALRAQLATAGEPMTLTGFLALQGACAIATGILALAILARSASNIGISHIGMAGVLILAGFFFPKLWLRQRVNARRTAILKSLPDAFDLITTCVEAGLGLDASLARVAEKVKGPFADELSRALREIALGKMRREALKEMADRSGVPDLVSFVNAVVQAEQLGSTVGGVLRVQSQQLRVKRRQRAEEQAQKAPIKMTFPLVLFIFPSLFIVILGPAVIAIMDQMRF